ncbi:NAD dependent epimerase/dehydratase [Punctularia strigosozonata HHB-11173 SS5]|uniref:NAD dependent epimerase/dehydratase n=1 Tax=Punctularia strigosozonata (strain HHB-11173) TaxID=741275 RepID=UPI0004418017|nr:NAD dependent epimerase/dehydratase [Punctularia strigosozonata HHB-11173 SS5]EIN05721.1 NAD dependent epimerase/dehydratase [Punctularia strigosozonata HHB-11173 SS5]
MDLGLKDVHVLVTGASGGIGLETTKLFLDQGARVTAHYNSNAITLEPLLDAYSPRIAAEQANLTSESDVARLINDASIRYGPVQVLVVNHAIYVSQSVPMKDMTLEQWNRTISANLTSSFLILREYLRTLDAASDEVKEQASVILIGSTAGKYGEAEHADYAEWWETSFCSGVVLGRDDIFTAMMYGLTLSLKNEIVKIAPRARVNTVAPGWVRTPMAEEALKDGSVVYRALATTPLKKVAMPRDVANHIVILSSNTISGHITGQVVMVEGGMEGRLLNLREEVSL